MTTGPITNTTNNNRENTITTSHDHTPHRGVAKDYYFNITSRPQLWETFRDLDNAIHFAECRGRLIDEATQNFVVDFGNDEAHAAFDLGEEDFAALLSSKVCVSFVYLICFLSQFNNRRAPREERPETNALNLETQIFRNKMDVGLITLKVHLIPWLII